MKSDCSVAQPVRVCSSCREFVLFDSEDVYVEYAVSLAARNLPGSCQPSLEASDVVIIHSSLLLFFFIIICFLLAFLCNPCYPISSSDDTN